MSGTIRSRMEAQRDRHESDHAGATGLYLVAFCRWCEHVYPCPDRVAADDTLTDLNNAGGIRYRLIPDPEESNEHTT